MFTEAQIEKLARKFAEQRHFPAEGLDRATLEEVWFAQAYEIISVVAPWIEEELSQ